MNIWPRILILKSSALILLAGIALPNVASASIIQADFRSELDLPFCCAASGPRVLERIGQTLPGAGFELDESDEIANPSAWSDALLVDLDPSTGIVSLQASAENVYETIDILISNMLFSESEKVVGFNIISSGLATSFDTLSTSFTDNSVMISYVGDLSNNDTLTFGPGIDTFQIVLASDNPGTNPVPAPATVLLLGLGLAGLGWKRHKQA